MISVAMAIAWYALVILGLGLLMDEDSLTSSDVVVAQANSVVFGEAGRIAMLGAGLAGIMTSWNAFIIGGSRAIYALARANLLPAALSKLHPKYRTPHNAILLIGSLSIIGPFFGRPALVWLVNAGGLGIVVAYAMVALSFLILRYKEPDLQRPYKVRFGYFIGTLALILSIGLGFLYMPGSPSALLWPQEWIIIILWTLLGASLFLQARKNLSSQ